MNILLTGATGFIGCAVARRLVDSGHAVHAILREQSDAARIPHAVQVHRHDGTTEQLCEIVQHAAPTVVVHMASLFLSDHTIAQVAGLIESNVLFGTQLLEAMRQAKVACFVNTGTCWQHFDSAAVRPVNLYAATKQAFDTLVDHYNDAHGISQVTLKLCDSYGPNDQRRKLVGLLVEAALSQEQLQLSPGEQTLDLTYIDDISAAFERAVDIVTSSEDKVSARYLVSGSRHTLREVVAIVSEVMSTPVDVVFGGRPYRRREVMTPSPSAEPPLPGWLPKFDFHSGLRHMLAEAAEGQR
ncbi:MAG: NAD(P)-dependent oxidoreductase [Pseudomonadota bacterium]